MDRRSSHSNSNQKRGTFGFCFIESLFLLLLLLLLLRTTIAAQCAMPLSFVCNRTHTAAIRTLRSFSTTAVNANPKARTNNMPKRKAGPKFYAVASGRIPGIYTTWAECQTQVKGFSNAKFKSFGTVEEAESFVKKENPNAGEKTHRKPQGSVGALVSEKATSVKKQKHNLGKPSSSFAGYVARNMERSEVRADPTLKRFVEAEIDKILFSEQHTDAAGTDWSIVPLVPLPATDPPATEFEKGSRTVGSSCNSDPDSDGDNLARTPPPHKLSFHVMFDGGSRGNPHGHAGAGTYVVTRSYSRSGPQSEEPDNAAAKGARKTPKTTRPKESLAEERANIRTYLGMGELTNNQAEYQGLLTGLEYVSEALKRVDRLASVELLVQGDSDLILKQVRGEYACKSPKLRPYHSRAVALIEDLSRDCRRRLGCAPEIALEHVYRNHNEVADALANDAMDARRSWTTTTTKKTGATAPGEKTTNDQTVDGRGPGNDDGAIEV
ncbi:unnamed protein product [Pseudo-nitzschia multistriata]|uniref:ribonuclease H n=1 Tax=Pseudo-nitzschia multistriata TaxID=183589 RepID=A0A448ZCV0_9STRA|nr:unnamed protein product [Pseudo-nitzschia multistriata]